MKFKIKKKNYKKGPKDKIIRDLLMKFQRTGFVHHDNKIGCPRKSGERTNLVIDSFERKSRLSTQSRKLD